jgi:protein-L-isoaspartate(D-aspartate) O-methyltransferase
MTGKCGDWQERAAALAGRLAEDGVITDPVWRDVVAAVPRHVFVPAFYSDDDPPELLRAGDPQWLPLVYSDETLVTQRKEHPDQPGFHWSTSSSTRPGLMLRMLHLLDVRDGLDVLEIGTGTGYNAALLSERLGSEHVTTVDIDPELADAARVRLADAGYRPTVVAGDGPLGHPARAPYARVIATVAIEDVPYAWVEQTRPGGIVLADIRPRGMTWAGALARLTVAGDGTARGPLVSCTWGFMSTRHGVTRPGIPEMVPIDAATVHTRTSEVGGDTLHVPGLSLLIWWRLPGINAFHDGPDTIQITSPDRAWAEVTTANPAKVRYGGPGDIWQQVERAHAWWDEHARPGVETFELTVGPGGQRLWYRTPDGERRPVPGRP